MEQSSSTLRAIPSIGQLLDRPAAQRLADTYSPTMAAEALRVATDTLRSQILAGQHLEPDAERIINDAQALLQQGQSMSHRPVINATGVLLHTNLGRAPMAECAAEAAKQAALHYTNLEFDCATGSRGDRLGPIQQVLRDITGAEDALVVNNNAAAMLLVLSAIAKGQEVVVSRGELVEIGGSFRVPDVMAQSGCTLAEVGTTNKTRLSDYERAIGEQTAALMKVHCSNYQIVGFTESVSVSALSELAHQRNLPMIYDLGSGALLPLAPYGLRDEPSVRDSLAQGADVVCFSGDKLLGGPQAGIVLGKAKYIAAMKKHPLMRALRADKMTLAALEATLRLYRDDALAAKRIPLYGMLQQTEGYLAQRAEALLGLLPSSIRAVCDVVPCQAQVGGGSAPGEMLPSMAVSVAPTDMPLNTLYLRLINQDTPIIARIHQDRLLLDMRTVRSHEIAPLAQSLTTILTEKEHP